MSGIARVRTNETQSDLIAHGDPWFTLLLKRIYELAYRLNMLVIPRETLSGGLRHMQRHGELKSLMLVMAMVCFFVIVYLVPRFSHF